mmetsp:Transcript_1307/g.2724  ORF Transcript_1307/g.2724 Transcript_1307/m.2724 type:complete len:122 (+) Transcript_1307:1367-1732(+)
MVSSVHNRFDENRYVYLCIASPSIELQKYVQTQHQQLHSTCYSASKGCAVCYCQELVFPSMSSPIPRICITDKNHAATTSPRHNLCGKNADDMILVCKYHRFCHQTRGGRLGSSYRHLDYM